MYRQTKVLARILAALLCAAVVALPVQHARAVAGHASSGGTFTVAVSSDPLDFDPAISFQWTDFYMLPDTFNGLMQYLPGTTKLGLDIAASWPTVSKDGRTYTITLRKGVMFQAPVSREVTASDFKYSWERAINPKTASPAVSYLLHIAGAKAYNAGKAKEVTGIKVLGPYTLQVSLEQPYVAFDYLLGEPVTYVVPHEIADKYPVNAKNGQDFSHHAVGTGPFMLTSWVPNQEIIWKRNPNYSGKGPYIDEIDLKIISQSTVAQLQLKAGQVDLLADGIAGLDQLRFSRDPQWSKNIDVMNASGLSYLATDTTRPPFSNVLVRQALAMAIDRKRLLAVGAGVQGGTIYDHIFAPGVPCQDPNLKGWPHDPAAAKALLAKAGYPHGFSTTILANGTSASAAKPELVLQQELAQIGINAQIKMLTGAAFMTAIYSPGGKGISFDGFAIDFPDPSDVVDAEFLTTDAVPGVGPDFSLYKNPQIDTLAAQADSEQDHTKRCALFSKIEDIVHQDAAWIPLYSWRWATIHSSRVKDLYLGPMSFDFDYRNLKLTQ
jgi:ABC-type transport system substrate-binding protein